MTAVAAAAVEPGVRERILAAAVDLFAEQGYDATSVAQVIARAGVAKGGFYHHFASKQELPSAVYGELIARQLAGMRRILTAGRPPAETLRALIDDLVVTTAGSSRAALVSMREMHRHADAHSTQLRRARRTYHDAVARLVREAQAAGEFSTVASAEMVTFTVFGVINELPLWYRPGGRKRPAQIAQELADLMLAALAPMPRAPQPHTELFDAPPVPARRRSNSSAEGGR